MNLRDLSNSLPNGFHDSEIQSLSIDFKACEARLFLSVWVGDMTSEEESVRERYKTGELVLSYIGYWMAEPPDPKSAALSPGTPCIDIGELDTLKHPPSMPLPEVGNDYTEHWMYINETNSLIYFSAKSANIHWD